MRISDWSSDVCSSDLVARKADRHRAGVRGQPFGGCEGDRGGAYPSKRGRVKREETRPLHEIAHRQPRRKAREAPGGQGGVRPRSEESSEGKGCVRTCRSRWSTQHSKKKKKKNY